MRRKNLRIKTKPQVFIDLFILFVTMIIFSIAILPMLFDYPILDKCMFFIFYGILGCILGKEWMENV